VYRPDQFIPELIVRGGLAAFDFYKGVFAGLGTRRKAKFLAPGACVITSKPTSVAILGGAFAVGLNPGKPAHARGGRHGKRREAVSHSAVQADFPTCQQTSIRRRSESNAGRRWKAFLFSEGLKPLAIITRGW
jgi:hypothetical protein